jgi:hypothetical protein
MTFASRQAVYSSLREFVPALRKRHHVVKLVSGRWCRTLGPPGPYDLRNPEFRYVAVPGRAREWRQESLKTRDSSDVGES